MKLNCRKRASRATARAAVVTLVVAASLSACAAPTPVVFPEGPGDVVLATSPDTMSPMSFRGGELVDGAGRFVQLHGVNMVRKEAPYFVAPGAPWLKPSDVELLRRSGFNAVRVGVWADALLPKPGVVDQAYLDGVQAGVDLLVGAGMWVLLDFHQDVFEGLPDWATTPAAAAQPLLPPEVTAGFWGLKYFSPQSMRQWEDLYARVPVAGGRSAVDLFGDGWAAVAARFRDTPNIIGIDLLNEPWPGERFFDCAVGGCGARYQQLASIYRDLTGRIREAAPSMRVWWAPFNWGAAFQGTPAPDEGTGLTFHSYCLGTDGGEPVQPDPVANTVCGLKYESGVDDALAVGAHWNTPVLLGEFGASRSPLNSTRLTELADEHLLSWMYWDYNGFTTAPEIVRTNVVRAYASATAGTPTLQRFDPGSGRFELRYTPDPSITAPTSVVLPSDVYPAGYRANVHGGTVTSPAQSGRLTVVADPAVHEVVVVVERRAS